MSFKDSCPDFFSIYLYKFLLFFVQSFLYYSLKHKINYGMFVKNNKILIILNFIYTLKSDINCVTCNGAINMFSLLGNSVRGKYIKNEKCLDTLLNLS